MAGVRKWLVGGVMFLCLVHLCSSAKAQSRDYGEWHNGITERWWFDPGDFTQAEVSAVSGRWAPAA